MPPKTYLVAVINKKTVAETFASIPTWVNMKKPLVSLMPNPAIVIGIKDNNALVAIIMLNVRKEIFTFNKIKTT